MLLRTVKPFEDFLTLLFNHFCRISVQPSLDEPASLEALKNLLLDSEFLRIDSSFRETAIYFKIPVNQWSAVSPQDPVNFVTYYSMQASQEEKSSFLVDLICSEKSKGFLRFAMNLPKFLPFSAHLDPRIPAQDCLTAKEFEEYLNRYRRPGCLTVIAVD